MSDFYSVLRQSILDRGLRSPAQREEVYGQARAAVIRQLWSYDPPLAEDEIDARIGAFDRTVERIEEDLVAAFAPAATRLPAAAPRSAPPARPVSVVEGYDDDADYVPATAQSAPPARMPPRPARPPRHDPLAERSAAIEQALRGDYGSEAGKPRDEAPGFEDIAPPETAYGAEDEDSWHAEDAYEDGRLHDFEEHDHAEEVPPPRSAPARPVPRPARQAPLPLGFWAGLSETTKVRALIGAIAALGLILLIAVGVAATSFLAGGTGVAEAPPPVAPPGIVTGAAQPATAIAGEAADVTESFTLFDGSDPTVFESSADNPVRFDKDAGGEGFARISSSTASPGVRVNIGPGIANRLAGQPVRVVIVARSAKENGAPNMRFAYQSGVALSHWQGAELGAGDAAYGLVWRVPKMQTDPNGDYLLIEPGLPGDGTAAEIHAVRLDLLAKEPG